MVGGLRPELWLVFKTMDPVVKPSLIRCRKTRGTDSAVPGRRGSYWTRDARLRPSVFLPAVRAFDIA
jgi:hypothetical protein